MSTLPSATTLTSTRRNFYCQRNQQQKQLRFVLAEPYCHMPLNGTGAPNSCSDAQTSDYDTYSDCFAANSSAADQSTRTHPSPCASRNAAAAATAASSSHYYCSAAYGGSGYYEKPQCNNNCSHFFRIVDASNSTTAAAQPQGAQAPTSDSYSGASCCTTQVGAVYVPIEDAAPMRCDCGKTSCGANNRISEPSGGNYYVSKSPLDTTNSYRIIQMHPIPITEV